MNGDVDWRALLGAALEHAAAYRESLPSRPVAAAVSTEGMLERLDAIGPLLDAGRAPGEVLEELVELATPGLTAMAGPRFFGWVTGGTLPAALCADWMACAWDQNSGPATGAPAAAAFELAAMRWVAQLLGLPDAARGALVSGATLANFTALAAARSRVLEAAGWDVERDGLNGAPALRIITGRERHDSIDKVVRLLGFGKRALRCVDADAQGRLVPAALRRELAAQGGPVIVVTQAGNVNSGAFDPMLEVSEALGEYRARHGPELSWWHIDGAFGLWALAAAATRPLARGAELADSWATDGHKLLNVPYDSGIVFTRHPREQRRAMAIHGAYLSSGTPTRVHNPGALVPELSRRARGFVLWAALRQLGRGGLEALVERCVSLAQLLAAELRRTQGLSVLNEVVFNQVVVHAEPGADQSAEQLAHELAVAIQREGTCYATPSVWRGTPALRFSVTNAGTRSQDIVEAARAVGRVYTELTTGEARPAAR